MEIRSICGGDRLTNGFDFSQTGVENAGESHRLLRVLI